MKYEMSVYIGVALLGISVFLSFVMILYFIIKGRRTPLLYNYILTQSFILIWSFVKIFEVFSTDKEMRWFFAVVQYGAVCFIGCTWLMFCLYYSESKLVHSKKFIASLFLLPALSYLLLLTNKYHQKFYVKFELNYAVYGVFFWVHLAVAYVYILSGILILIRHCIKEKGNRRKQVILLMFGTLVPFLSNVFYVFGIVQSKIDITSVSFTASLLLFVVGIYKYRLLDISPLAIRETIDHMDEAIIVVDDRDKVIDCNKAFTQNFLRIMPKDSLENINEFIAFLRSRLINKKEHQAMLLSMASDTEMEKNEEISLELDGSKVYYNVNVRPIFRTGSNQSLSKIEVIGRVITLNDITIYKNLIKELEKKNEELLNANTQLKKNIMVTEELAMEKERNRLARDIHDTLGHTLTLLIALLEATLIMCRKDPIKAQENLSQAIKSAREGFYELKSSISGFKNNKMVQSRISYLLEDLIRKFKASGLDIDFAVNGLEKDLDLEACNEVYRVCQEALTNALRHGKASQVSIILKFFVDKFKLYIFDNGTGCKNIQKGFGLHSMEQRIKRISGTLTYGSDGEKGFNIHIEIPLGLETDHDKNNNCG